MKICQTPTAVYICIDFLYAGYELRNHHDKYMVLIDNNSHIHFICLPVVGNNVASS